MLLARTEIASTTAAVEALCSAGTSGPWNRTRWSSRWTRCDRGPARPPLPVDLWNREHAANSQSSCHPRAGHAGRCRTALRGTQRHRRSRMPLAIDGSVLTVEHSSLTRTGLGRRTSSGGFRRLSPPYKGTTGGRVRRLQEMLAQLTFYTGPITGIFDDETEMAVAAFQRSRRLFADAIVAVSRDRAL